MSGHGRSASGGSPAKESARRVAMLMTQQPVMYSTKFLILGPWIGLFALSCLVLLYSIYHLASGQAVSNPRDRVPQVIPRISIPVKPHTNVSVVSDSREIENSGDLIAHILYFNRKPVAILLQNGLPSVKNRIEQLLIGVQSNSRLMGVEVIEDRHALGIESGSKNMKVDLNRFSTESI